MTHRATSKRSRFSIIGETIAELKKVVWLTRREAAYLTFMVLIVAVIVAILLGAFDFGFTNLVDKFFLGG
ncbi:MAG: preprotein translocase subunit SecE [Deltaproteobacteria bacterium]|nr:preprotein translocase subunit SecE [Deltaproteobacteria bacterium]